MVFGMGGFVIVAAVHRAIYCLVPSLISYVYTNWYFREASVAVYVTNLPGIWLLLRDIFPGLGGLTSGCNSKALALRPMTNQRQSKRARRSMKGKARPFSDEISLDVYPHPYTRPTVTVGSGHGLEERGSRETVPGDQSFISSAEYDAAPGGIRREVTITVEREANHNR